MLRLDTLAAHLGLTTLARVDNTDYCLLEVVIARDEGGNRIYCLYRDWGESPMGRIANLELIVRQNTERFLALERELSRLRTARPGPDDMQELLRLRARCEQQEHEIAMLQAANRTLAGEPSEEETNTAIAVAA